MLINIHITYKKLKNRVCNQFLHCLHLWHQSTITCKNKTQVESIIDWICKEDYYILLTFTDK